MNVLNKQLLRMKDLNLAFGIYCSAMLIQNILATKQIDIGMFTVTTGIMVSPILFIIQDVITELKGLKIARKIIFIGFVMNFIFVILSLIAIKMTPSQFWQNQREFSLILSSTPRIVFASFVAYLFGSNLNVYILEKMKKKSNLFSRVVMSTLFGQFLDNAIFATIAFIGVLPYPALASIVIGATLFEVAYEIILYPICKYIIVLYKK